MIKYYEDYDSMKIYSWEMKPKISEVRIRGTKTKEMPMWIINNYIKSTCDNYTKLLYILNILDIFSNNKLDIIDIGISTESVPIDQDGIDFENKLIDYVKYLTINENKEKYCLMSHISERYMSEKKEKDFLHYFNSCERPVCFAITKDIEVIFLYNPRGDEGIKVCDISYHSPIDIGLGGIGECINHLISAGTQVRNDSRLQNEYEARMVEQALHTMGEAINVQDKLHNTNLPGGQKEYLQNMYNALMAKQEKLNIKIGVCLPEINVRI